jgi:hypothetical protein
MRKSATNYYGKTVNMQKGNNLFCVVGLFFKTFDLKVLKKGFFPLLAGRNPLIFALGKKEITHNYFKQKATSSLKLV